MDNNKNHSPFRSIYLVRDKQKQLFGLIFIILIIINFYISPYIYSLLSVEDNIFWYLESISSYLIIVSCIIIFTSKDLESINDHYSLWVIVLGIFWAAIFGGEDAFIYKGILILLGSLLAINIIINRKGIKAPSFKSLLIGLAWSVISVVIIASIYALFDQTYIKPIPSNMLFIVVSMFLSQLAFVTIVEEVCFRGLIFNLLIMNGYKENKALFIQAILFWGMHFFDRTNPILFYIVIPLATLSMTLIMKKYKMVYLPIIVHTILNVFTTALVTMINRNIY